ncbi:MAG: Lrp/AsnC family transcriptional regulator [Candidatus Thorarchaeota archaeon]|nr:Lrp/AsnC family transcriptional regulator [Candidatus Thorarchaeota archaeon]
MSSVSQRPVGGRSIITLFYILALGSGVMRTFSVAFDIVALRTVFSEPVGFGFLSQWTSLAVTFAAVSILSLKKENQGKKRPLGYNLDPDFGRFHLLPKTPMLYLAIAGFFAGISTFFYYTLVGSAEAANVLPYGQLVVIYLLLGDLLAEKDTPTIIEIQSILSILFGALLVGMNAGGFDLLTIFIVLVPMNISSAFYTYFQRKTKRHELTPGLRVDSLNMRLWSLLFLNISFSALAIPALAPETWQAMSQAFVPLLGYMIGSSLTAFVSIVMYVRALGRGSMAVVNSLSSISVVLGIPLTLIGNFLIPGAFGELPSETYLMVLQVLGITLIMLGVISLQGSDVRAMVLIKVKPQTGDLLPELYDIKGVESAAAMAGVYDYMLSIKSRSLSKTRTGILKKVQAIPQVQSIETIMILKDYR